MTHEWSPREYFMHYDDEGFRILKHSVALTGLNYASPSKIEKRNHIIIVLLLQDTKVLKVWGSNQCLDVTNVRSGGKVKVAACVPRAESQQWEFQTVIDTQPIEEWWYRKAPE